MDKWKDRQWHDALGTASRWYEQRDAKMHKWRHAEAYFARMGFSFAKNQMKDRYTHSKRYSVPLRDLSDTEMRDIVERYGGAWLPFAPPGTISAPREHSAGHSPPQAPQADEYASSLALIARILGAVALGNPAAAAQFAQAPFIAAPFAQAPYAPAPAAFAPAPFAQAQFAPAQFAAPVAPVAPAAAAAPVAPAFVAAAAPVAAAPFVAPEFDDAPSPIFLPEAESETEDENGKEQAEALPEALPPTPILRTHTRPRAKKQKRVAFSAQMEDAANKGASQALAQRRAKTLAKKLSGP